MRFVKCLVLSVCVLLAWTVSPVFAAYNVRTDNAVFKTALELVTAFAVAKIADLNFGTVYIGGDQEVVVNPVDDGAARFHWDCRRVAHVRAKVIESSIKIKNGMAGANNEVVVNDWSYSIDRPSETNHRYREIRVGGIAHVKSTTAFGSYSGTATLRVTYL